MTDATEFAERWRDALAAWAIPEEITSAVSESPWTLPKRFFARRTDQRLETARKAPDDLRALGVLPPGGTVLDVGAGTGAASLPLAATADGAGSIIAVDTESSMLDELLERARGLRVPVHLVVGRWPDIAGKVPAADVVVCHNVLYNVPDIQPFLLALTTHARRRVVAQITANHPMSSLNPLWLRFHGLRRPERPVADDVVEICRALGLRPQVARWSSSESPAFDSFDALVEVTRRRLCLPAERAGELATALQQQGVDPAEPRDPGSAVRERVAIWWDGTASSAG